MSETKKKQRRQRAVLSCNDCRRRKLKCDRELPCNRCVNGDIADQCAYGPDAHGPAPAGLQQRPPKRKRGVSIDASTAILEDKPVPSIDVGNFHQEPSGLHQTDKMQLEQLQRQVALLKQRMTTQRAVQSQKRDSTGSAGEDCYESTAPYMGFLRGRHYGTFFFGPSSVLSIMAHFPDLRNFSKDLYRNSTAQKLAMDMRAFERRSQSMASTCRVLSVPNLQSLLALRATVDLLVRKYFDTFETTYRVLHIPSFEAAYSRYWDLERTPDSGMDAVVLGILACAICITTHDTPRYNLHGSSFQSKAVLWLKACEAWLKRQSNKHRTLASLQVRCLRLIALSVASYKVKVYYEEVQEHMAFMRSSGLHRDPGIFGDRCSIFEAEMRRRLWATSMELELEASIDKGSPSVMSGLDYDCLPPQNINDADLAIDLKELPQSLPLSTFTDTSFLHISMNNIGLRRKMCAITNSLKPSLSFLDTFEYIKAVQKELQVIPRWANPKSKQAQALLDLQLRESLLVMYSSRALRDHAELGPEGRHCIIGSLEMSAATIELHTHIMNMSNYALALTRHDYVRAALLICHITYHASKTKDKLIAQMAKGIFDQCMPKALNLLESRIIRHGRSSGQHYWYMSAATALIGRQFDPSQFEAQKLHSINRLSQIFYKMISRPEEPTEQSLATEISLEETFDAPPLTTPAVSPLAEPLPAAEQTLAPGGGMPAHAFDVTSDWTLDDLWFFNDVPALDFHDSSIPSLW